MSLFPSLALILLAIIFRILAKSWTAPGALFAIYWAVCVTVPLLVAPPGFPVSVEALWWIVLFVFVLGMGASLAGITKNNLPTSEAQSLRRLNNLEFPIVMFSMLGIIGVFVLLASLGQGISIFLSMDRLKELTAFVSESRYTANYTPPKLYILLQCFTYAACYLGGMLWTLKNKKLAFLPFLPVLLGNIVQTTKAGILFTVFIWVSGWLATRVKLGKLKIQPKIIIRICLTLVALTATFILMSALRYKVYNTSGIWLIYDKLTIYYFGYLSGFSQWFLSADYQSGYGYGRYTFAGVFDLLGLASRNQGIFNDIVVVGGNSTNIYTLFRYLIQDVGFSLSLVLLSMIGLFFGWMHKKTSHGSIVALSFLMMFYTQTLFSNTTSVFGYNIMIMGWLIAAVVLWRKAAKDEKPVNVMNTQIVIPKRQF